MKNKTKWINVLNKNFLSCVKTYERFTSEEVIDNSQGFTSYDYDAFFSLVEINTLYCNLMELE